VSRLGSAGETAFGFRDCARGVVDITLFFYCIAGHKKKEPTTIEKPINPEMLHNQGLHLMTDRVNCYFLHAAEPSLAVDLPMA
jgi:hypothetical protein